MLGLWFSFPCALLRIFKGNLVLDSLFGVLGKRLVFEHQAFGVGVESSFLQARLILRAAENIVCRYAKRARKYNKCFKVRLAGTRFVFCESVILDVSSFCQFVSCQSDSFPGGTNSCSKVQNRFPPSRDTQISKLVTINFGRNGK